MEKLFRIAAGLLLGSLVGAGLALLFAPKSGAETRLRIQAWAGEIQEAGQRAAEQRRQELEVQLEELKRA